MKKILLFLIILLTWISMLHIFWYLKIWINEITGLTKLYNGKEINMKKELTLLEEIKKNKKYNKSLEEFDRKINSFYNYYYSKDDCYKKIKDYKNFENPTNKGINIDYTSIENGKDSLLRIIRCNIYNSITNDIYIRIPFFYVWIDKSTEKTKKFIELYQKNWYNIHLIYVLSNDQLNSNKNVFKFLNNKKIKSLSFIYEKTKDNNIFYIYKKLRIIENFYIEKYKMYHFDTSIWIKSLKKDDVIIKKIMAVNKKLINWKYFIEISDNYFESEEDYKNIINYVDSISKNIWKNDMLQLNFKLKKENVDKIDWPTIYHLISDKNIIIILPNSIILNLKDETKEEEFITKIKKEYENSISKEDMLIILYKYRMKYLEKKVLEK